MRIESLGVENTNLKTEKGSLTGKMDAKDQEISWLRNHQTMVIAPPDNTKITQILQKLAEDNQALRAEPKNSLKKRGLQVSHDILQMLSDKKQPPLPIGLRDSATMDDYSQKYTLWMNEIKATYLRDYAPEAIAVLTEMKTQGIDTKGQFGGDAISNCRFATNPLVITDCGVSIGAAAQSIR